MHRREQGQQFAQFFEEVEEIVHTPSRNTSRVVNTPNTRMSVSDLERTSSAMTPRMEIMLKKERKAKEEQDNLTFRPHVNRNGSFSSKSGGGGKDTSNRFDALYSDALKRHLETKWKETTTVDEKELTFTPKITERGRTLASSRSTSRAGSRASSREREGAMESAVERLHNTPKGKLKHGVDPDNKLTFKPEITKRAMSIDRKESAKRLYVSNSIEKEKTKAAMREMEVKERELENCTFSPKVNQTTKYTPNKEKVDLRERMSKFEEMKKQKILEAQKQKIEQELADATFKPTLKAKLKRAPTPTKPFHERLAQPFERHVPTEVAAELSATMTFKPTLVTKRSASPNGRASEYSSVHERLFKEGEQRKKETILAMEALKQEAETNFTFSPEINQNSKVVSADAGPVFERLATCTSKQYMQEVLMKVKTELELKECTFHPKLSTEGHKYIPKEREGDDTPVHHRLNQEAEAKRAEKERLEQLRIENSLKHHTFSPQINENSKSMVSMRSFVQTPDGNGSVAPDDIFTRLNAQTIIAKSPHIAEAALANQSPSKARSIVMSEKEHADLYERLSAPPRTLTFQPGAKSQDDDRASSANRRSQQEIDSVIQRLHGTHTKAMKADPFEVPPPLHTQLRSRGSFSGAVSPSASPDKSFSRRNSLTNMDIPSPPPSMTFAMSPVVGGVKRSMSMSASPPSGLSRAASVKTMIPPSPSASAEKESAPVSSAPPAGMRRVSSTRVSGSSEAAADLPPAPKVVPRKPKVQEEADAPAAAAVTVAPPVAPKAAPAPAPAPVTKTVPAKPAASSARGGGGGDDFLSKIEASMNMLTMNPADIVAQQAGVARASPPVTLSTPAAAPVPIVTPTPVPVPAPTPAPAAAPAPSLVADSYDQGSDEEVEVVDENDL